MQIIEKDKNKRRKNNILISRRILVSLLRLTF